MILTYLTIPEYNDVSVTCTTANGCGTWFTNDTSWTRDTCTSGTSERAVNVDKSFTNCGPFPRYGHCDMEAKVAVKEIKGSHYTFKHKLGEPMFVFGFWRKASRCHADILCDWNTHASVGVKWFSTTKSTSRRNGTNCSCGLVYHTVGWQGAYQCLQLLQSYT